MSFYFPTVYQAGLGSPDNPEQVMIALEPEAAAISCLEKNMSEFQSETGCRSVEGLLSQPNTHYMVVDIGGKSFFFFLLFALRIKNSKLCSRIFFVELNCK